SLFFIKKRAATMMSAARIFIAVIVGQDFFRQPLMKDLRASPVRFWDVASLLQSVIRCCERVKGLPSLVVLLWLRHVFINCLRASPCRFFVFASALQVVMRVCWLFSFFAGVAVCARAVVHKRLAAIAAAQADLLTMFIVIPFDREKSGMNGWSCCA